MDQNLLPEDDRARWEHEVGSEPQWVKDQLKLPWATMIAKNGDFNVVNSEGVVVAVLQNGNSETKALVAAVICDRVNDI